LIDGPNDVQLLFDETMGSAQGFGFNYGLLSFNNGSVNPSETPLPAALPLFVTGLGALGLLGWRDSR